MPEKKDQELAEKIMQGNEKTLALFYRKHKKPLLNFVNRKISDRRDAEEVVQDAFLDFVESLRDFRGQSSLKTYLYSIAKYKAIDHTRKKKIKRILFSYFPAQVVESLASVFLEDEIERKFLAKKIERVFRKLPNDYAAILRLKYKEGYKVMEIAEKLERSFKATESLLFRARKAFVEIYVGKEGQKLPEVEEET